MEERRPLLIRHQSNGRIPTRSRCQTQMACGFILVTEILERIAFYGIVANLVLFLGSEPMNWSSYNAAQASMVFTGLCYTTSLFGGWLADSVLGRFKTISLFFVIYIVGYILMPVLAHPTYDKATQKVIPPQWCSSGNDSSSSNSAAGYDLDRPPEHLNSSERQMWIDTYMKLLTAAPGSGTETCSWAIYLSLTIMAIGTGAVKANVAPFGADQVKHEGPYMMRAFFNWFYWCINLGAFLAIGVLAYVQQEQGFFPGLVAPNVGLVLALAVFASGFAVYIMKPPGGSVLTNIVKILIESCQGRRRRRIASTITRSMDLSDVHSPPNCLDHAKVRFGGSFHDAMVDDVKILGKIICVFLALIPYWVVYFQMESTYVVQGVHMRLGFGNETAQAKTFQIPAAWLSLFDVVFLIVLIPVMDRVIYPRLDRAGYHLTLRLRIIIGMLFSLVSVTLAGGLEMYRLSVYWKNDTAHPYLQTIGGTNYSAANVSVLWQIPQYAFIGVGEVFTSVAGLELAYTYAPRSMQGIIMGLFWFTQGVGSLVGTATVSWFQGVFFFRNRADINCRIQNSDKACHLDYYFFFLSGLQVVGMLVFIAIAIKFDIGSGKAPPKHRLEISSSTSNESPLPSPEVIQPSHSSPPRERHIQNTRSPLSSPSTSIDVARS